MSRSFGEGNLTKWLGKTFQKYNGACHARNCGLERLVGKYISAVFENLERGHSGERVERWKEIRSCGSRFSFILEKKADSILFLKYWGSHSRVLRKRKYY